MQKKIHESTLEKARIVKKLVDQHYEQGNQARSKSWVYRKIVSKQLPMSHNRFWVLLKIAKDHNL